MRFRRRVSRFRRRPIRRFRRRLGRFRRRMKGGKFSWLKMKRPSTMPDCLFVKMKWFFDATYSLPTETDSNATFRMNDIYLPTSIATTRAYGFDQYAAFYNRFEVLGAKIRVNFINLSSEAPVQCVLYPSEDTNADGVETAKQYPYARWCTLGLPDSGTGNRTLRMYGTIRKMEGRRTTDTLYTGATGSSPSSIRYFHVAIKGVVDSSTVNYNVAINVMIVYYVRWYTRQDMTNTIIPSEEQEVNALLPG